MIKIDIDPSKQAQLLAIAHEPIERLEAGTEAVESSLSLKTRGDLKENLEIALSHESAEALSSIAISFSALMDDAEADLKEALDALLAGAKETGLDEAAIDNLQDRLPFIERLSKAPRVRQIGKVREIREGFGPHLMHGRIFTFSCPIFNHERDGVDGTIILSRLRLTCIDSGGQEEVKEVTINLRQLRKLSAEIERAISKSACLGSFMEAAGQEWVITYDK